MTMLTALLMFSRNNVHKPKYWTNTHFYLMIAIDEKRRDDQSYYSSS